LTRFGHRLRDLLTDDALEGVIERRTVTIFEPSVASQTTMNERSLMKPRSIPSGVVLSVFACMVALQMSSGLVAGGHGGGNDESKTLTLTKDCGPVALSPGELKYCTVIASNFRPLRGAKIRYFGPGFFAPDHQFLDSWVVIESEQGGGGTAFGHCLVRGVPEVLGACQFTGGSGSLKGFKADVTVTTMDGTIWYWNGAASHD
jgi:hypothetical protein